jgi:hypothetical protein
MPHAVKLSTALVQEAKAAAEVASRSVASQIEHWARLGRAVEQDLAAPPLTAVTLAGSGDAPGSGSLGARLGEAIEQALQPAARKQFAVELAQRVRYGTDPAFPGYVVRDEPDGTRTPGRYSNREFLPLTLRDADD